MAYNEAHDNLWSVWDTGFYGFSEFALELQGLGLSVSVNTGKLSELSALPNSSLLILNVAKYRRYLKPEIDFVVNFVRNGGRLLVFGEHDNMYRTSEFQNELLSHFGVKIADDAVGSRFYPKTRKAFSKTFGLEVIKEFLSASIQVPDRPEGYQMLLEAVEGGRNYPIGIGFPFEKGKIAVLGDSELFWNGAPDFGIASAENTKFLRKLVSWLFEGAGCGRKKSSEQRKVCSPQEKSQGKVFIDTRSGARAADTSPSGLLEFAKQLCSGGYQVFSGSKLDNYDVRLIAGALSMISDTTPPGKKLILLAEATNAIHKDSPWDNDLLKVYSNRKSIYRNLEHLGFQIAAGFLSTGTRTSYLSCQGTLLGSPARLHTAGGIILDESKLKPWPIFKSSCWLETRYPAFAENELSIPAKDEFDVLEPIVAARNSDILVLADSDLLSNAFAGEMYFSVLSNNILRWLSKETPQRPKL